LFACACSQNDISRPSVSESNVSSASNVQAGDFAPGELEAHYLKHGYQFGSISQDQYLENARELLNSGLDSDVLEKTRSNGDILRYRVSTSEFAVMASDGRIRTYFKADYRYWSRQ
jgi:pyocin large subunit-like protein